MVRGLLIVAGTLCVLLGVAGIFLPLLPTTPFLLVAATCYARSSERLHRWFLTNRLFGGYVRSYHEGRGMPPAAKASALILLWTTMGLSAWLAVPPRWWWAYALLLLVAIGVTIHILRIKPRCE